jgi:hypothetical protein
MSSPLISVVIIVDKQRERGDCCLASVLQQSIINDLEVILVDLAENVAPLKQSNHPAIRCITIPGAVKTMTFGEVRAEALRIANAPIIAFLEEHSAALPGWASATLKAFHELGDAYAGVSGPPINDLTQTTILDAIKLMNALNPLPAHSHRDAQVLTYNNTSYRRDVLLKYDNLLPTLLTSEGLLYAQLIRDGYKLAEVSDIKFIHVREKFLSGHGQNGYYTNRNIARQWANHLKWSNRKKFLTIIGAPLLPWARTAKLMAFWWRKDPTKLGLMLRNILTVTAINYYAVLGQAMGLAFGEGDAGIRYLDYAVNVPRPMPDMDRILKSLPAD